MRIGFKHPLSEYVQKFEVPSEETTKELFKRIQANDQQAKQEMIQNHYRYAFAAVARFGNHHKELLDDLVSEALVTLTDAVNRLETKEAHDDFQPTKYICIMIYGSLKSLIQKKNIVHVNIGTWKKLLAVSENPNEILWAGLKRPIVHDQTDFEIEELIAQCELTGREKQVLGLRLEGKNDIEIGELLKVSKQAINKCRRNLKSKISEKLNGTKNLAPMENSSSGRGHDGFTGYHHYRS